MNKIAVMILSSDTYPSVRNSNVQKKLLLKDFIKYFYKQNTNNN